MNAARLITAVTFAIGAGSAFAHDDVQHYPTPSTASRASVQAAATDASPSGVRQIGEATVFSERAAETPRSRAEVSAEARQAAQAAQAARARFTAQYVGA